MRSPVPIESEVHLENRHGERKRDRHERRRSGGDRSHHAYRHGSRAVRQASSRKRLFLAEFAGDAGSPGVAADSNGLFHGLGDHASNSFSIDGQPITDQQSKVFSNQLPVDAVQSMEVIEGAPPAEYGGKTSLVIVVTTRSGLGVTSRTATSRRPTAASARRTADSISPYGGKKLGQLHFRQRHEHRPVSGWAGVHRDARSWQ